MTAPTVGAFRSYQHRYQMNGRGSWPGVTTITNVLAKPALVTWLQETAIRAAITHAERLIEDRDRGDTAAAIAYVMNLRDESDTARERGSRVHAAVEASLSGTAVEVDPGDAALVEGALAWMVRDRVVPVEVEALLFNETEGYGGTADLFAEIDGETWLLDWKTSKTVADSKGRVWPEMRLQLAAYAHAEYIGREGDPAKYPVPAVTRYGIVHVTADGSRLYPADVTDADWDAFLACLRLYNWKGAKAA